MRGAVIVVALPTLPPGRVGTAALLALALLVLAGLFVLGDALRTLRGVDQLRAVGWGLALVLIPGGLLAGWLRPALAPLGGYAMLAGAAALGLAILVGLLVGGD